MSIKSYITFTDNNTKPNKQIKPPHLRVIYYNLTTNKT